jgi:electron transfer flavoprotein beta subunit
MNIAVCVKQVPDTETKIKISDDKRQIDESDINFILNPYDEFAVEEAIKTKEAFGGEITIISLGPDRVTATIRSALAMGADKAIHIKVDKTPVDPGVTATALASVLKEGNFDMIFMGKQAIDDDNAQVTPMVSELLDIPAVNVVTKLEISGDQIRLLFLGSVTSGNIPTTGNELILHEVGVGQFAGQSLDYVFRRK